MDQEKQSREFIDEREEAQSFLKQEERDEDDRFPPPPTKLVPKGLSKRFWVSASVNTASTAAIVFVNKQILQDAALRHAQVTFAAFHFAVTFLLLYIVSRPAVGLFPAIKLDSYTLVPLALAMIFNVVLPNASLAFSTIQFYQVARVLLTPCVAALNYGLYNRKIPTQAALTLIPICLGVAVVSYFDTMPAGDAKGQVTRPLGVVFAVTGVLASSLYTVWIKWYHERLECSSMQLLMNQAPISVLIMLYVIPFSDDITVWSKTTSTQYALIAVSGLLACLINLSQFVIINEAGPVSSTVVGHFKTCSIIAMGWMVSGKSLTDGSLLGIALAIGGIVAYSYVMQRQARN
ncbi:Putative sugar phosphate transporter domain-containing protein [Septoria linicola]|uniref:Sugar phosphate transporter domain-containing protein n=1 Tax=Septoria linicola TaxID=215465 RepID=A0A9Q9EKS7_9PEZI|nr:Putative sugar phosphate transporter domain-containing protein [Septoria linicola]